MNREDLVIFVKALDGQVKQCQRFVEKINYDLSALLKYGIAIVCREDRGMMRETLCRFKKVEYDNLRS